MDRDGRVFLRKKPRKHSNAQILNRRASAKFKSLAQKALLNNSKYRNSLLPNNFEFSRLSSRRSVFDEKSENYENRRKNSSKNEKFNVFKKSTYSELLEPEEPEERTYSSYSHSGSGSKKSNPQKNKKK